MPRRSRTAGCPRTRRPWPSRRCGGDLAPRHAGEDLAQRRQVEDVRETFAVRLDEDREAPVARGDREQVRGPLALLPQRRACPRASSWQEQRPPGVLPEPAGEQAGLAESPDDEILDLVRIGEQ